MQMFVLNYVTVDVSCIFCSREKKKMILRVHNVERLTSELSLARVR